MGDSTIDKKILEKLPFLLDTPADSPRSAPTNLNIRRVAELDPTRDEQGDFTRRDVRLARRELRREIRQARKNGDDEAREAGKKALGDLKRIKQEVRAHNGHFRYFRGSEQWTNAVRLGKAADGSEVFVINQGDPARIDERDLRVVHRSDGSYLTELSPSRKGERKIGEYLGEMKVAPSDGAQVKELKDYQKALEIIESYHRQGKPCPSQALFPEQEEDVLADMALVLTGWATFKDLTPNPKYLNELCRTQTRLLIKASRKEAEEGNFKSAYRHAEAAHRLGTSIQYPGMDADFKEKLIREAYEKCLAFYAQRAEESEVPGETTVAALGFVDFLMDAFAVYGVKNDRGHLNPAPQIVAIAGKLAEGLMRDLERDPRPALFEVSLELLTTMGDLNSIVSQASARSKNDAERLPPLEFPDSLSRLLIKLRDSLRRDLRDLRVGVEEKLTTAGHIPDLIRASRDLKIPLPPSDPQALESEDSKLLAEAYLFVRPWAYQVPDLLRSEGNPYFRQAQEAFQKILACANEYKISFESRVYRRRT